MTPLLFLWYLFMTCGLGYSAYRAFGHSLWSERETFRWILAACGFLAVDIVTICLVSYFR